MNNLELINEKRWFCLKSKKLENESVFFNLASMAALILSEEIIFGLPPIFPLTCNGANSSKLKNSLKVFSMEHTQNNVQKLHLLCLLL